MESMVGEPLVTVYIRGGCPQRSEGKRARSVPHLNTTPSCCCCCCCWGATAEQSTHPLATCVLLTLRRINNHRRSAPIRLPPRVSNTVYPSWASPPSLILFLSDTT